MIMLLGKLLVVSSFIAAWLVSRRRRSVVVVSDVFCVALLLIFVPTFLLNPTGTTTWNGLEFSTDTIFASELGVSLFFLAGIAVFTIRCFVVFAELPIVSPDFTTGHHRLWVSVVCLTALAIVALMLIPQFRAFRVATLGFLLGNFSASDYVHARSEALTGGALEAVLGRLRFVLFPLMLSIILWPLLDRQRWILALCVGVAFFLLLPLSMSKLPFAYYAGYLILFIVAFRFRHLDLPTLTIASCVGLLLSILGLTGLYLLQYPDGFPTFTDSVRLALERIWGESYSVIVRYFAVYPNLAPFTGTSGIGLFASLSGVEVRNPDLEVPIILMNSEATSNPGIFFLAGYAAFGYLGLFTWSFLGFLSLWIIDLIELRLQDRRLRLTYFALMSMNVLFLLQVALQTALLTYGVAVLPLLVWGLDRLLWSWRRRSERTGTPAAPE